MTIADINTLARFLSDTDTTSLTAANLLIFVNAAYEKVVGKLISFIMRWQFDDTNYTNFPQGKADLVAGQKDYSFDSTHLAIEAVEVMDQNGDYYYLKPLDKSDLSLPWDEYFSTDGAPEFYDKDGKSVILGPGPAAGNVTTTNGLKVHFRRTADKFTSGQVTTGTKEPGFASPFHPILAYEAAITYCTVYKPERVPALEKKLVVMYDDMEKFYSKREKDERNVMTMARINFR